MPRTEGGRTGELFNGYRAAVPQDEKRSGDLLQNSVNVLSTTVLYIYTWFKWKVYVICFLPQFKKIPNSYMLTQLNFLFLAKWKKQATKFLENNLET